MGLIGPTRSTAVHLACKALSAFHGTVHILFPGFHSLLQGVPFSRAGLQESAVLCPPAATENKRVRILSDSSGLTFGLFYTLRHRHRCAAVPLA